jgi:carboxypeptidase Taq
MIPIMPVYFGRRAACMKKPSKFHRHSKARLSAHLSESYQAWTAARPANDFSAVQPYLEKTLELSREYANFFPGYEHIADPLIDLEEPNMNVTTIRTLFSELRTQLVPIIKKITEQAP